MGASEIEPEARSALPEIDTLPMFLTPFRIHRPDLREEVAQVLRLVHGAPAAQQVPLAELVRMMGVKLSSGFQAQVDARGDLGLDESRFHNQGPVIARKVRLFGVWMDMEIADRIEGSILRQEHGLRLRFAPGHSLSIQKYFFHVELRQLDLAPEHIIVDFAGAQDLLISLS